ncbi:YIP1 family protein [Amaricoccus sp.]|uniref:YIP1 family protein n=1 Tax=Amaricoccus sp. TaxID=1872485 RepID=UPI001B6BA5F5|nr:YIP1 family protein [Amaricoccus sp.]MBP7000125.1 YIP1 family protein [Amaricoccus sp.]
MWGELVAQTFLKPREAARRVLAAGFPPGVVAEAALAVTSLGIVLGYLALRVAHGVPADPVSAALLARPLVGVLVQLAALLLVAWLTATLGRRFGGRGDLLGAATAIVWLNAATLVVQVLQLVALVLAPPLAAALAMVTLVWLLWAFACFVAELHGFASPAIVLGVVVLVGVSLVFLLTFIAALAGLTPQGTP